MGLLDGLLGIGTSADPLNVVATYAGERTTDVLQVVRDKVKQLELDPTCDKRLLSLIKIAFIILFRQNPF